ncbi:MAG: hypothetical protein ACRDZP_05540, partial [Acidimicrobiales bacterium]
VTASNSTRDPTLPTGVGGPSSAGGRPRRHSRPPRSEREVLLTGSVMVALLLTGFVIGPTFHVPEWEVALGADVVMLALTRSLPLSSVPWGTALVAAGLAVLSAAAVRGLDVGALLEGHGPLATLKIAGVSALGANVVNNLPAFLIALPSVGRHGSCTLWPVLLGVNAGPSLLVTGSLASLLWVDSMRRLGSPVTSSQFFRMGIRVGLPAGIAALGVLVAMSPLVGCG